MQPEALREAGDWLIRAERDLLAAQQALEARRVLLEVAAFHAQQAVEKAFKAFLAAHNHPLPRTHDLEDLVARCQISEPAFSPFLPAARRLNPYVIRFRYPSGPLEPDLAEAQEAVRLADEIVQFVRERLVAGGLP